MDTWQKAGREGVDSSSHNGWYLHSGSGWYLPSKDFPTLVSNSGLNSTLITVSFLLFVVRHATISIASASGVSVNKLDPSVMTSFSTYLSVRVFQSLP